MTAPARDRRAPTTSGVELQGSVLRALTPVLRRWRLVFGLPLAVGVVAAGVTLITPPTYTAITTFIPAVGSSGPATSAGLASLATQFGISIGTTSAFSPD